ncbi:MAG: ROK family protein [Balneolia bacterium]|nr:ROK family protein [Balneolia bacterium]
MMLSVGIDLGGTNIKAALVHREKGILKQISVPTDADSGLEATLDRLGRVATEVSAEVKDDVAGVGIGAPGMISLDRKSVQNPPNLPGWDVVPLADEITKRTGLKCLVENDANLMALGSARYGSGRPFENFIMITLGTGVGGGIIIDNKIFRGATGAAGELGHVSIDYQGAECNSTVPGAIEAYLGQRFMSKRAAHEIEKHPENDLYKQFSGDFKKLEPLHLTEAANRGNQLAIDILADAGRMLGYAIVNYAHVLDVRKYIISGGVSQAGDLILKPAFKAAMERLMPPFRTDFEIIPELLGNEAALLGAGTLALENL